MIKEMKMFWRRTYSLLLFLMLILALTVLSMVLSTNTYLPTILESNVQSILKITLAAATGSLIGQERSNKNRPAGLRTHSLVCMGAAIVMVIPYLLSQMEGSLQMDVTRLGAQVISGIGFLGAGTIIRNGSNVKGLTTAATLWVVAILGLAIGAGLYVIALVSTLIVLMVLRVSGGRYENNNSDDYE